MRLSLPARSGLLALAVVSVASVWRLHSAHAEAGLVHPRQVQIETGEKTAAGVLIDGDTAWWQPEQGQQARRVCAGNLCAQVLTLEDCADASCPTAGVRLVLDRPLASVDDWPEDPAGQDELALELRHDDVLAPLLGAPFRRSEPITWGHRRYPPPDPPDPPFFWELTAAAATAYVNRQEHVVLGGEVAIGPTWRLDYSRPSDWAFGNVWGASLHGGIYGATPRVTVSLSLDSLNVVGHFDRSRLRAPSLIGVVVPEIGLFFEPNAPVEPLLRWRLPFQVLLTRSFALDARPTFTATYPTSGGEPGWMAGVSVGALLRLP